MSKRILVTGGAGFIGSHLTKRLVAEGADVTVVVKYKSIIDNVRLSSLWDNISVMEADLRNTDSLRSLRGEKFDIIYHLAAYNHVGDSFLHVNEALMSNLTATANILESEVVFKKFVYMASSEVYGFQSLVPFKEESIPFPISPYAVGKYAGELYARMKNYQLDSEIVSIRPFNTFGPYQSDRAIIPELIIKCLRGQTVETTEGKQTREFNYVSNIVDALTMIGDINDPVDEPINIGTGDEIAICDLTRKIHELSESKSKLCIGALQNRPTEIWRMCADNKKAKKILGWEPKVPFDEGLRITIEFYKKYLEVFYSASSKLNRL